MFSFLVDDRRLMGDARVVLAQGNADPIAVDDPITVLRGEGPVTISVLDNDVDPEGQPLTLVSAFAALGTAVAEADNTVTYTPPASSAVEADTVVYEIADVEDARDTGQIDITISEPVVEITTLPNQTLEVSAGTAPIDIAVTTPAGFAGTYTADLADLSTGPINLVAPGVTGTLEVGEVISATDGLWIYESGAGVPSQSWRWQLGGVDITGATGRDYTVQAGDLGPGLTVVETQADANGARDASSLSLGAFNPTTDTALIGWWDADDAGTISEGGSGAVTSWANKAGAIPLAQSAGARQPTTGVRSLNGRNIIDFDGGDFLDQAMTLPVSGDVAFHMVLEIDSTANAFEAILAVDGTNDFQIDANNASQFDGRFNADGIGSTVGLTGGPFSGPMVLSVVCDLTGAGQIGVFINDVSRGTAGYTAAIDPSISLHVMTNRSRNAWVNGAVAELLVTGDVANRASYHSYLAAKWGLV